MEISRRTFVIFGAGATVGFLFTPINWKMMNEGAIWSQNWPWVPVPEDGETTYANSTCKLCPGACGIKVRLIDGKRAIKIEGDPQHPVNQGGICALGLSGLQVAYGPDRIKTPLIKVGERGSGQWKAISWDRGIRELAAKLSEQRAAGPQGVAVIDGEKSGTMRRFWERFMRSYGSPNHVTMPSLADTEELIGESMHGVRRPMGYDLENAKYVLSFGADLIDGWGGCRAMHAWGGWRGGDAKVKVVHVSAMPSMTSSKADEWVAVQPGTEPALALGMANVILSEGLAKGSGAGLEDFKAAVAAYSPSQVASITGVKSDDIVRLAKEFASTSPAVAVWGSGKGEMPERLADAAAVQCLNGLVGAIGAAGGVAPQPSAPIASWGEAPVDDTARAGLAAGRLDGAQGGSSAAHDFVSAAGRGVPYPIKVLMVYEANPAFALANTGLYKAAAANIPFIVSFASSMDETAAMADLILPNPTYLERWDSSLTPPGLNYPVVSVSKPVIGPLYETKHTAEVMTEVAKAVGGSAAQALTWASAEEMIKSEVGALVADGTYWSDKNAKGAGGFSYTLKLPKGNIVPRFQSAALSGSATEMPLLAMPYSNARITQMIANPPYMTKTIEDTVLSKQDLFVNLNPGTASDAGVAEGAALEVKTASGSVKVLAHIDPGTPPGVVGIPVGFGHTAQSKWIAGKGVNANDVLDVERDSLSGLARWSMTRARIIKA
jgi:anaerobic selenocysteine-containing dehydrogenase